MMQPADAHAFAREWIASWNARDVESVLSHYDDTARFTSPKAAVRVGSATVTGKDALRAYWLAAIALIDAIHFELDHALWDPDRRELVVVYDADINGQRNRACELMQFGASGQILWGEAMYGAALETVWSR